MFDRILVAVDGSAPSNEAVRTAARLAVAQHGALRLVHVLDQAVYLLATAPSGAVASGDFYDALRDSARKVLDGAQKLARATGANAECVVVERPELGLGEAIAEAAAECQADLVVVGTSGRRGPSRLLLGSGAEQIIRLARVPALVVRATKQG